MLRFGAGYEDSPSTSHIVATISFGFLFHPPIDSINVHVNENDAFQWILNCSDHYSKDR